jgi:hypothetical protein
LLKNKTTMYVSLLIAHNLVRWVFLAVILVALFRSIRGMSSNSDFNQTDNKIGGMLVGTAHLQLLIGLLLWFVSPVIQQAMEAGMGAAMKDPAARLQLVEHPLTMLIAVVLIQVGRIRAKKAYESAVKHKRSLVFYGLALILVLSRIPWNTSPMFRF